MSSEAQDKRDRIRAGAFAALMAEGLAPLSYDRIAREAGVTRQLVRYYYPNPDDLMIDLCNTLAGTYREALIACVMDRPDTDRLRVFFDFYFDLIDGCAKPRDDQAYDALFSLAANTPAIRRNLREQYTLLGQTLTHELRVSHPTIPIEGCAEISYLFVTLMYGHWKMVATLGLSEDHRHVARRAMDRIVASYLADATPIRGASVWSVTDPTP